MTPGTRVLLTFKHAGTKTLRGDYLGIEGGKVIFVESTGLKRVWRFWPENVKAMVEVRQHKKRG